MMHNHEMTMIQTIRNVLLLLLCTLSWCVFAPLSQGEIVLVGGFFSGNVDRFDTATGAISTFATIGSGSDPFPGISGLAYNPLTNRVYASSRISNRIYSIDANTGAVTGFHQLADGTSPASVAVDSAGFVYVANNSGNTITKFNSGFNTISTITLPNFGVGDNFPSGLAFDSQGNLMISTFGGVGVVKYDPNTSAFTSFNANPVANGQVAIDGSGNVYVGGAAFSNSVAKMASDGSSLTGIEITEALLPMPTQSFTSPNFTSPSGVAIDASGNVIVAALGRTNPTSASDNFQSNGGLFLFDSSGTLIRSSVNTTPYSSALAFTAVPEPTSFLAATVGLASIAFLRRRRLRTASDAPVSPSA